MYLSPGTSLQQPDTSTALIPSPWQLPPASGELLLHLWPLPLGTDVQTGHLIQED